MKKQLQEQPKNFMQYHILKVQRSKIDEQCFEITLMLKPERWERLLRKIPTGKITYRGYGQRWYTEDQYRPAPPSVTKLLFAISYNQEYRHIQKAAEIKPLTKKAN